MLLLERRKINEGNDCSFIDAHEFGPKYHRLLFIGFTVLILYALSHKDILDEKTNRDQPEDRTEL